jgi:hypothetical protein
MVGRKAWSLVEQKVLPTPLVRQKEPRSDFQMARSTDSTRAWKKETPTDSNLASTKELESPWEQLRENLGAGPKVLGEVYCSVENLAIHLVFQESQPDPPTD